MFGNFCLFKTPFLGRSSVPTSFVSFFVFYILFWVPDVFCQHSEVVLWNLLRCSFDEFVGEKVIFPSYSSDILGPPATAVFLPGESQGGQSLVGCRLWGLTESDTTEAT